MVSAQLVRSCVRLAYAVLLLAAWGVATRAGENPQQGLPALQPGENVLLQAVSELRSTLADEAASLDVVQRLAWLLATHPDPRIRDGALAVQLARLLPETPASIEHDDLLAAAYAASGDTQRAIAIARSAAARAVSVEEQQLLQTRIAVYRQGLPLLEPRRQEDVSLPAGPLSPRQRAAWSLYFVHGEFQPEVASALLKASLAVESVVPVQLAWARHLWNQQEYEPARKQFERALQRDPADAEGWADLATLLKSMGQPVAAISHYWRALNLRPAWPEVQNSLAWLLATAPDAAARDPQQAMQLARAACQATQFAQPDIIDTLAVAQASAGDFQGALMTLQRIEALCRKLPPDPRKHWQGIVEQRRVLFRAHVPYEVNVAAARSHAVRLHEAGQLAEAAQQYQHVLRLKPGDPQALADLATICKLQGRSESAIELYIEALKQRPEWVEVGNALAWLLATENHNQPSLYQLGEVVAASACIQSNFRDLRLLDTLAVTQASVGRFDAALKTVQNAQQVVADSSSDLSAGERSDWQELFARRKVLFAARRPYRSERQQSLDLGELAWRAGHLEEAASHYSQALQHDDDDPQVLVDLGTIRKLQGRREEALDLYERALEHWPDSVSLANATAWLLIAEAEQKPNSARRAVELAERTCHDHPDPRCLNTLAAAYAALGDFDRAATTIEKALQSELLDSLPAPAEEMDWREFLDERLQLYRSSQSRLP